MEIISKNRSKINYWMGVVDTKNWNIVKRKLIFGVEKRFFKKIKQVKKGDLIAFYILGKKIGGTFKINSKLYYDPNKIFKNSIYPYRIKIQEEIKIKEKDFFTYFITKLSFIENKARWGGYFQGKAIIKISKEDFNKIKKYLEDEK